MWVLQKPVRASFIATALMAFSVGDQTALAGPVATVPTQVEKLEVVHRQPAFGGASFGATGQYEVIAGVATVALDPAHPNNRGIVDIQLARDEDGKVRYQTDVVLLRPVDGAHASGVLVVDIPNRGNKLGLVRLNGGANQMETREQAGNGWLMRNGHSMMWVGWQGDVPLGQDGKTLGVRFPTIQGVTGRSHEEVIFDSAGSEGRLPLSYPAAAQPQQPARLTVKATADALPRTIPATDWRYVSDKEIRFVRPADEDNGAIYQFSYDARDPVVMGLGMAALRDVTALMRAGGQTAAGETAWLNDVLPQTVVVMGISQSGRFLRDVLWQGFGETADGQAIFDGAMPIIAGARKSFTNVRWAQPGRYSRQHEDHLFPGDQFPFSYAVTYDPISEQTDGIFARCEANATCPKLMHVDSSLEYWQARSSLLNHDGMAEPIAVPENVRFYLMGSTQHGPAALPLKQGVCQTLGNPAQQAHTVRALMSRLIEWSAAGTEPPASRFPRRSDDTLVSLSELSASFPDLTGVGVRFPQTYNRLTLVDPAHTPPLADTAREYQLLLPQVDADGHDIAAIRAPDIAVPLATHTGWALRAADYAEDELCGINGSMIPFAATAAERAATQDPRRSLAERYPSAQDYVDQVASATTALVQQGYLLEEDAVRWQTLAREQAGVLIPETATP